MVGYQGGKRVGYELRELELTVTSRVQLALGWTAINYLMDAPLRYPTNQGTDIMDINMTSVKRCTFQINPTPVLNRGTDVASRNAADVKQSVQTVDDAKRCVTGHAKEVETLQLSSRPAAGALVTRS